MKVSVVRPPSVRLSTFSNDISEAMSLAVSFHISHIASIGRGNEIPIR